MTATKPDTLLPVPDPEADLRLRRFTGYLMKRAFNVVQDDLTRVLEQFDLRLLSFSALQIVVEFPDITQTQLAQMLDVERSNIVVVLDKLEDAGLLTRNAVPNNRRAYALRTTLAGRRLAEKAINAVAEHEARLFAGIDPDDLARMRAALAKIAQG
jgi:DNA-binding MarR family transcriptional regulator